MLNTAHNFFSTQFTHERVHANGETIAVTRTDRTDRPPLLLVHGYPQFRIMWHKVVPSLSEHFTLIIPDLRGYGASSKPPGDPEHTVYSKRAMADDLIALMDAYGFHSFFAAGHDRGGRVLHRLALDHPHALRAVSFLDIVPTRWTFDHSDKDFAKAYYHWYFLQQPSPFPETVIGAAPNVFLKQCLETWSAGNLAAFGDDAIQAYCDAFGHAEKIHATCEDYRAAMSSDYELDQQDRGMRVACPVQCIWGSRGFVGRQYDVLQVWREHASNVEGQSLDCGHFPVEERPGQCAELLLEFFQNQR